MSPHAANSLVHDLVEMAKAMEQLPQAQADLINARGEIDRLQSQVQRLELRLVDRANEIDSLNAKVREADQARDNAETMFLETDERLSAFRHLVSGFSSNAASLLRAQEPEAKPEPTPAEQHAKLVEEKADAWEPQQGQSEVVPTSPPISASPDGSQATAAPTADASEGVSVPMDPTQATESSSGSGSEGSVRPSWAGPTEEEWNKFHKAEEARSSTVDPTAPSPDGPIPSPASAATDAADTVADAPASASETHGPYHGMNWSDVYPRVYNYDAWIKGGGTSEGFNL